MRVDEIVTQRLVITSPTASVRSAAAAMRDNDVGTLPVIEEHRLVGIVTDRDIVVRVVADEKPQADLRVRDIMTEEVHCCRDDDDVEEVAGRLGDLAIRRMPVLDKAGRVVGIVSLDDIAVHADWGRTVAEALRRIAQ
ncbi:MAG TPA: CBS domain-containing protein [Stellaceae bacterium]|nr:CBS domain-containing protein [Stellaceae bacterium]